MSAPAITASRPEQRSGVLLMLAASVMFAVMATSVGAAHQRDPALSTWTVSLARSSINLLALVLLARGRGSVLWGDGRPALWARGVAGAVSLLSYFASLMHLTVGEAAFLNQTSAVWVALLGPVALGERTGRLVWIAILGSLVGVALLAAPRGPDADWIGRALGLLGGLGAALAYLTVRRASTTNGPIAIVFYFTLLSSIISGVAVWIAGSPPPRDAVTAGLLVCAGLSATAAQLLMTAAYGRSRAGIVAAAGASGPLFNTLFGALALGQLPDRQAALGMAVLAVTGLALPALAARQAAERP